MNKTIEDIVKEYAIKNGYNALYYDGCGCVIDDLAPCDSCSLQCGFGVVVDCEHCDKIDTCEDSSIALGYDACEICVPVGWCDNAVKAN